jgi:nucleoside-diphosphate-sugar epimerase
MANDVLVTGATGFLGAHLVARLRDSGSAVVAMSSAEGDVADPRTWRNAVPSAAVVHLAGRSFVPDSWQDPAAFIRTNVVGTVHALEHCRKHSAPLVFLSSYLYGHPRTLPIPESAPTTATNPYALSKLLAEQACRFYAEQFGLSVTVLRVFNVYGPGQPDSFLIPSIVAQIAARGEIVVQDLTPKRDYVYVQDVVNAIERALATGNGYRVLNIGSGMSCSVAELIELTQRIWASSLPVRSRELRRPQEIMDTVADITAARELLGWTPTYTLEQGLRQLHASARVR